MWYMHYGVPEYFSRAVRDVPNKTYHEQWIGRGGPTAWLPHSPCLNSLDFYLWEHLRALVYVTPSDNKQAPHQRIVETCQIIHNYSGILERMRLPMMRRVEACV
jgi:hypothetical protein